MPKYFRYFVIISPWKRGWPFIWIKLASPSHKNALCQVWLKLALWFWRRKWKCEKFMDRWTDGPSDWQMDRQSDSCITPWTLFTESMMNINQIFTCCGRAFTVTGTWWDQWNTNNRYCIYLIKVAQEISYHSG